MSCPFVKFNFFAECFTRAPPLIIGHVKLARQVLFSGNAPLWHMVSICSLGPWITARLGFAWFQKTRRGFADVQ